MFDLELDYSLLPPNMVTHFKPHERFLDWLVDFIDGRMCIEVGAGQCELTKALISRGVNTLAIEPRANPLVLQECVNCLLPLPVEKAANLLAAGPAVVIGARPDHSGWFAGVKDMLHPESVLLYIGLPDNLETDVPGKPVVLYTDAGEDCEVVYRC